MALCPKCHGTGLIRVTRTIVKSPNATALRSFETRCDYEGCVGGVVYCCEGDQAEDMDWLAETHERVR